MSNTKQLGLACMQYVQDYDEVWFGQDNTSRYPGYIWPYIKSRAVFTCPADRQKPPASPNQIISYSMNSNMYSSQGLITVPKLDIPAVTVVFFEAGTLNGDPTAKAVQACAPNGFGWCPPYSANGCNFSNNYWPCDEVGNYLETGPMNGTCSLHVLGDDKCYGGGAVAPTASTGMILDPVFPTGRHLGGSCFTFADGHAKWMPGTLVSTGAVNGYGATFQAGQWWADSPKAAQKKGMVTFATQ